MNMQDKEFDQLFQSKLGDMEMEPSAQVWENIDAELNGRKKKGLLPWLSIAAGIIVLVIAGVLFIPQKPKDDTNKPVKDKLANNRPASPAVKANQDAPVKNTPGIKTIQPENPAPVSTIAAVRHTKKTTPAKPTTQAPVIKTEPVKVDEQQMIAAVTEPKTSDAIQHSVPDATTTPLTIKQPAIDATPVTDNNTPDVSAKPVLASAQIPATKPVNKVKKHGIRNFGDLVNLVVAKVDKRKDKVIQFTDTDDDGSTLTGVHVGAINIKKDNK